LTAIQEGNRVCDENAEARSTLIYSEGSSTTSAHGWGGARNHAGRISHHIKLDTALELVDAARWAVTAGVPFNRHLTVHWAMGGIPDNEAAGATGRLTKLIGDWVKKRGSRFAHAWVREMGPRKGSHAHVLLHIPNGLKLGHMTRRWVGSIVQVMPPKLVLTKPIGGSTRAAFSGSDWYEDNLAAVVAYILKGVSPKTGETLGLDEYGSGGRIIGKRLSISQNLRPAGRGQLNPCDLQSEQRSETSVITLTPFFSESLRARARARREAGNQNFSGETGEAA